MTRRFFAHDLRRALRRVLRRIGSTLEQNSGVSQFIFRGIDFLGRQALRVHFEDDVHAFIVGPILLGALPDILFFQVCNQAIEISPEFVNQAFIHFGRINGIDSQR